jgi:DNA-binding CsgD family transcriptional regulator
VNRARASPAGLEREFRRLGEAELSEAQLRIEAAQRIAQVIPHDGCCISSSDPGTLVLTGTWTSGIPAEEFATAFYESEHGAPDYARHQDLVAGGGHAAVLGRLTRGQPARSARYRRLLAPMGIEHELRAAAVAGGAPWAFVHLYRRARSRDFDADELAAVRHAVPRLAASLRRVAARPSERAVASRRMTPQTPATILVDRQMRIVGRAGPAREWLAAMRDPGRPDQEIPVVVMSLVLGALLGAPQERARVLAPSGAWWSVSASVLEDCAHADTVAVTAELARGHALSDVLMMVLGLTPGERRVCELVLTGASTKLIARSLYLSTYTVQDRLKTVFAKAQVGSRGELVSRLCG